MAGWYQDRPEGVVLFLLVQPRASKNEIVGVQGDELKIRLTSPPVEGAANRLCCEFLARIFRLPKGGVALEAGETSRHKRVLLRGVTVSELSRILLVESPS